MEVEITLTISKIIPVTFWFLSENIDTNNTQNQSIKKKKKLQEVANQSSLLVLKSHKIDFDCYHGLTCPR